jgi:hypothetical protein
VRYNFGVTGTWFIGADLAWREGTAGLAANQTGVAVTGGDGQILDAGWTRGVGQIIGWADRAAGDGNAVMFADAPLVVASETSQRLCETQARQGYGRWKVSADTANVPFPAAGGQGIFRRQRQVAARRSARLGDLPVRHAGRRRGTGYDTERRRYKRKPPHVPAGPGRAERAANCDTLIERLKQLADADSRHWSAIPPTSTAKTSSMPCCAPGTIALGAPRLRPLPVLGMPAKPTGGPAATMIVPARPEQLLQPLLSAAEECDLRARRECTSMPCIELPADQ